MRYEMLHDRTTGAQSVRNEWTNKPPTTYGNKKRRAARCHCGIRFCETLCLKFTNANRRQYV
ncbi:hypothetical protein BSIN_2507 [Burkholderia singularis]|uniref:Uncharacterized protein n=1 Tax=Burkholderia singularis TaxID=1503053 RepID=A0A238H2J3_9BURK|nr:hypothetical protein BSIN_2507 [Burkholderia singularis]